MRPLALLLLGLWWQTAVGVTIPAVAYHDIVETRNGDPYAITVAQFEDQLAYLKRNDYQPIGLRDLDAARRGTRPLPPKPVLLTFDDGLRSFSTHAWPRLQRYGYPAVVSIVTSWVDGRRRPDWSAPTMTWDELRALADAPALEVISHSDDLHRGIPADAEGTHVPAATAPAFDATARRFEDDSLHRARVAADLARSVARMRAELRQSPRAIAWPYGEYDGAMVAEAAALGMDYHLTLSDAPTTLADLPRINRFTWRNYHGLDDFVAALAFRAHERQDWRFVQIDLAGLQNSSVTARDAALGQRLERLQLLRVNAAVLAPFTDDGSRALFHTTALPSDGDLALRATMALLRRTGVARIYVRLPPISDGDQLVRLATDYLRRHPLHGLLIDGDIDTDDAHRLRALIARYRPNARLFLKDAGSRTAVDGRWREVEAESVANAPASLAGLDPTSTLVVVRRNGVADGTLKAALRAARQAGVRHFGYTPDDAEANQPDPRTVVVPLHAHTIRMRAP